MEGGFGGSLCDAFGEPKSYVFKGVSVINAKTLLRPFLEVSNFAFFNVGTSKRGVLDKV